MKFNQSLLIKKPHYTIGVYGWLTSWLTGAPVTWRRHGSAGGPGQLNLSFRGSRETAVYFSGRWPTNFQFRDNWLVDGDENWKLNYCEKKNKFKHLMIVDWRFTLAVLGIHNKIFENFYVPSKLRKTNLVFPNFFNEIFSVEQLKKKTNFSSVQNWGKI